MNPAKIQTSKYLYYYTLCLHYLSTGQIFLLLAFIQHVVKNNVNQPKVNKYFKLTWPIKKQTQFMDTSEISYWEFAPYELKMTF